MLGWTKLHRRGLLEKENLSSFPVGSLGMLGSTGGCRPARRSLRVTRRGCILGFLEFSLLQRPSWAVTWSPGPRPFARTDKAFHRKSVACNPRKPVSASPVPLSLAERHSLCFRASEACPRCIQAHAKTSLFKDTICFGFPHRSTISIMNSSTQYRIRVPKQDLTKCGWSATVSSPKGLSWTSELLFVASNDSDFHKLLRTT